MIHMIWQYLTEILEAVVDVVVAQLLNFVGKSWPILLGADQLSAAADGAVQGVEVLLQEKALLWMPMTRK